MPKLHDISGQRFGMLTAVERISLTVGGSLWRCRCDCGADKAAKITKLRRGEVQSCGCSTGALISAAITTHGLKDTGAYQSWASMKQRCLNKNSTQYPYYGGRGITICASWLRFEAFFADMGDRPPEYSIERIDSNGPYSPENCKWVPKSEQSRNRNNTRMVTFQGQRMPLGEAAEKAGVSWKAVHVRIRRGWPEDRLLIPLVAPKDRIDPPHRQAPRPRP